MRVCQFRHIRVVGDDSIVRYVMLAVNSELGG